MRAAPEVIALKTTQPVRQFITSGSADQQVPDFSVFRKEFVSALEGEADLNKDGYVTGSELGSYLEDKVTNYSRQTQTPQYGKIQDRNLDKGDFVFALNRSEPPPPPPEKLGPAAPAAGGMSLDAIRKQQALRDGWDQWQARMRSDYEQVDAMSVAPELKATAWEQFLAAYPQTNPYSQEADTLRGQARAALLAAKQQAVKQAVKLADGAERAKPAKKASTTARLSFEPEMVAIPGKDYEMGKYEVTQAQYQACVDDGGCKPPQWLEAESDYNIHTGSNDHYKKQLGSDRPAIGVSWDNAQTYVQWLSRKTGKTWHLPTEAEWKHACDGGVSHKYCGGNNLDALGWYDDNSGGQTHPVGQKQANGYGLHDMSGNVWEWQQGCYDGLCSWRVLRGGSWDNYSVNTRAANRNRYSSDRRDDDVGFRVVVRSARTD